jgi:hypothetical protein
MDPIDPISSAFPVRPVWPVWPETHPGFQPPLPDAIPYPLPKRRPPAASPEEPAVAPFDEQLPVAPAAAPARELRRVLLDAGVRGIGPLGPGFPLTEGEMVQELQWVYRHIAKSLIEVMPEQPSLPAAIVSALSHDARDEREMGLLLIAHPNLADYLQGTVSPGLLNRWHQQGEHLLGLLQQHPKGMLGDLHLVETPDHRWQPF